MGEITSAKLAEERGISKRTAERWLTALENEHGPSVVGRRGTRLVTTRKALAKLLPVGGEDDETGSGRVVTLEKRVGELEEANETARQWIRGLMVRLERLEAKAS